MSDKDKLGLIYTIVLALACPLAIPLVSKLYERSDGSPADPKYCPNCGRRVKAGDANGD